MFTRNDQYMNSFETCFHNTNVTKVVLFFPQTHFIDGDQQREKIIGLLLHIICHQWKTSDITFWYMLIDHQAHYRKQWKEVDFFCYVFVFVNMGNNLVNRIIFFKPQQTFQLHNGTHTNTQVLKLKYTRHSVDKIYTSSTEKNHKMNTFLFCFKQL
jgi:hypothetical protein